MVDLIMERRRREKEGAVRTEDEVQKQDQEMLLLVEAVHLATLGRGQHTVASAVSGAYNFMESLMSQMIGQQDLRELLLAAHSEVALVHLLTTIPATRLARLPLLGELGAIPLTPREALLAMVLAASRPRPTWPQDSGAKLGLLWDLLSSMVRRACSKDRLGAVLQLAQQVQALTCYLQPLVLLASLEQALGEQQELDDLCSLLAVKLV